MNNRNKSIQCLGNTFEGDSNGEPQVSVFVFTPKLESRERIISNTDLKTKQINNSYRVLLLGLNIHPSSSEEAVYDSEYLI